VLGHSGNSDESGEGELAEKGPSGPRHRHALLASDLCSRRSSVSKALCPEEVTRDLQAGGHPESVAGRYSGSMPTVSVSGVKRRFRGRAG